MDRETFDAAARVLGAAATRRAGLAAALAAALAMATGGSDGPAAALGKRPRPAGPCGDGSRKDNSCTKNKDCCTGLCNTKAGRKNRDGKGRCRCVRKRGSCTESRNCCGNHVCVNGTCGDGGAAKVPTGQPCTPADVCAAAAASCTVYADATPAGTYCLIPAGGACAAANDCDSHLCTSGVCEAACIPNVCASGCAYTDVETAFAAIPAGGMVMIAPGTYTVGIDVDKSMTVRGCGDGVILQFETGANAIFYDIATGPETLTLRNLTLEESSKPSNALLYGKGNLAFDVTGCAFRNAYYGLYGDGPLSTFTDCTFSMTSDGYGMYVGPFDLDVTDCTFEDSYGAIIIDKGDVTIDGCTFSGQTTYGFSQYDSSQINGGTLKLSNSTFSNMPSGAMSIGYVTATFTGLTVSPGNVGSRSGAGMFLYDGTYSISNTTISSNTTTGYGGGLMIGADKANVSVTLGAGVSITGNAAADGSGIAVYEKGSFTATVAGAPAAVSGNTGGDQCVTGPASSGPWTGVTGCAY
ncbi:MAG: right-handed parallel beta-helix repeat-containing protein [Chloroflexota bacterium]